ncbi:hypothetical protein [Candidatus Pantoea persica]|uniref:hypothetical protein n=1 Tax=Candidatus Pantoea persica TaxID=2518128 RepID=UPI00215DA474|nr:hypothetical protein [Candidatus Pantoea persica]
MELGSVFQNQERCLNQNIPQGIKSHNICILIQVLALDQGKNRLTGRFFANCAQSNDRPEACLPWEAIFLLISECWRLKRELSREKA